MFLRAEKIENLTHFKLEHILRNSKTVILKTITLNTYKE